MKPTANLAVEDAFLLRAKSLTTLKVYGDESADATRTRVFSVATVIGTEDEWTAMMRPWLRRTRGLPFHANKCESEYARRDRAKHDENLTLYRDLVAILASSHLVGLGVSLDLKSHQQCLPGGPADIGYYKCFTDVLLNLGRMTRAFNAEPDERDDARLEFTFDSRLESNGTAGTIYTMLGTLPQWADTSIFDAEISFESSVEPRLEVADLVAREAMKEFDRKITQARPEPRKSFQALEASGKFIWIEHDLDYCERWRDQVNAMQGAADFAEYQRWLVDTGRVQNGRPHDNMTNRVLFYAWLEKRDALSQSAAACETA